MSQFTIYSSSDINGPGPITGTTGSFIKILDACLVNGYSGKPAAGWTKPLGSISASCVTAYRQPSGSQFTMFVNDNAMIVATEAGITGYTLMSALTSSVANASNVGTGWGQFPMPWQALTVGKTVLRKSLTADTTQRSWILAADAYTMYFWAADGKNTGYYEHIGFGDFYSLYGTSDIGRCLLFGRHIENDTVTFNTYDMTDAFACCGQYNAAANYLQYYLPGHFIARGTSGSPQSIRFQKKGDATSSTTTLGAGAESQYNAVIQGNIAAPNPYDNSYYFSPIWVVDPSGIALRGRYRGIYQICHPYSNFSPGQIINGSGKYVGKQFMIIYYGYNGGGWALEVSNTLETN